MRLLVIGAGAGGVATAIEMMLAGHDVALHGRSVGTLRPLREHGLRYDGVLGEGVLHARLITDDLAAAMAGAEGAIVALPTLAHAAVARALAACGWPPDRPILLNPGHTGGALAFTAAWRRAGCGGPCVAAFATLAYVARKTLPHHVGITGRARMLRAACLPGGEAALALAGRLFPGVVPMADVLACDLANVNMVLHPPGAVLAAAWVEATGGDFTFYVDGMTAGVARVMRRLDQERLAVAAAFGHALPDLIGEMRLIGTVPGDAVSDDYAGAISAGVANRRIKAPDSLLHRYYTEDFGHGLTPFMALAAIAAVSVPTAAALSTLAAAMMEVPWAAPRDAAAMGIAGHSRDQLLAAVRH